MNKAEVTEITGVRTVGVPVADQDRALEFYVETLGLEKRLDVPLGHGNRWIEVAPAGAATTIALVVAHEGVPAGVETGIRFTTEPADALKREVRSELEGRREEWREPDLPDEDELEATGALEGRFGGTPPGEDWEAIELRSDLARHLDRTAFPATRAHLLETLAAHQAGSGFWTWCRRSRKAPRSPA